MDEIKDGFEEWFMHTYDLTEEEYAKFVKLSEQVMNGETPMGKEMAKGGSIFHE